LQGHFTKISSKVRKLQRERERSVLTAVYSASQTMTEPEKSSHIGETHSWSRTAADGLFIAHSQSSVVPKFRSKTKSARPTWCSLSYNNNARPKNN